MLRAASISQVVHMYVINLDNTAKISIILQFSVQILKKNVFFVKIFEIVMNDIE